MAKAAVMEFKRGAATSHVLKIPIALYAVGSSLFFTVKPQIDNDSTDTASVIDKEFTDSSVVTSATYATYTLDFEPDDIAPLTFDEGETEKEYIGEFKFVRPGEDPEIYPDDDTYIKAIIYANIKLAD